VAEVVVELALQKVMEEAIATGQQVHIPLGDAETATNKDECTVGDDMQRENRGPPVEEESWLGYLPEYVPDYSPVV
jgi:hypothetical protein